MGVGYLTGQGGTAYDSVIVVERKEDETTFSQAETIYHIHPLNGKLYVTQSGGLSTRKILKIDEVTMSVDELSVFTGDVQLSDIDESSILFTRSNTGVTANDDTITKISLNNLGTITAYRKSDNWGCVYVSNGRLFVGEYALDGTYKWFIRELDYNTLSPIASLEVSSATMAILLVENYLYCGGNFDSNKIYKIDLTTFTKTAESVSLGGTINSIKTDGQYLYVGGGSPGTIRKIDPSTMGVVATGAAATSGIGLEIINDSIFTSGIFELNKTTLSTNYQSTTSTGSGIYGVFYSENKKTLYSISGSSNVITRIKNLYKKRG